MAFLKQSQLEDMGFASFGTNVLLSDKASIYGADRIALGSNVRIDDFCILSAGAGGISIGSFVHIAAFSCLLGAGRISVEDFSNISSRVSIFASSDDYSGVAMTNPMIPSDYTNVHHDDVRIGRHVIIGSGSVVLPGVVLHEGVAVGALSFVNQTCAPFGVYAGTPAKWIKERRRDLLDLEAKFSAVHRAVTQ